MTNIDSLMEDVAAAYSDLHRLTGGPVDELGAVPAPTTDVLPLLAAAMHLIRVADELTGGGHAILECYGPWARARGHSWNDIARALHIEGDDPQAARLMAFDLVAPDPPSAGDPHHVNWDCKACDAHITDRRPVNPKLADIVYEQGHAADCTRRTSANFARRHTA